MLRFEARHEAKPMTVKCLNDSLCVARIADGFAQLLDAGIERGVADDSSWPHALEELGLRDSAGALLDQMQQQREHPRPQWHERAGASQLASLGIEDAIEESVSHGSLRAAVQYPKNTRWMP